MRHVKVLPAYLKGKRQGEYASVQKKGLALDPHHGRFVERCPNVQSGSEELNRTLEISRNCWKITRDL